jgi:nucleoside transporter
MRGGQSTGYGPRSNRVRSKKRGREAGAARGSGARRHRVRAANPLTFWPWRVALDLKPTPLPMQTALKVKLSAFMFLQYFIWGCWYVSLGAYLEKTLDFSAGQVGLAYGAFAIGAMVSPFIVGLIADRFFASEKLLALLGIAGGVVLFVLPQFKDFGTFYPMLILYCSLYVPTLALGNSLSLTHLTNAKVDFPRVKMLSAVGWIGGLVAVNAVNGADSAIQFQIAGGVSILFGIFSLALPHTPPTKTGADVRLGEILGLDALGLLRKPSFAIFILCMFLICIPLYFYFVNLFWYLSELKWENILVKTSLAQVSDVLFFLLLPFFLKRFGYKKTIFLGIACWVARYFALSGSVGAGEWTTALVFTAILLHGACYDFLFIAGQLYVDDEAGERTRGAAQGFIAFILWGVGNFVGTFLAGQVRQAHKLETPVDGLTYDWAAIWQIPAWGALGVLLVFLIFFRDPKKSAA